MRLGVVSNTRSLANRRSLSKIERLLLERRDIPHERLDGVAGLRQALGRFAASNVDAIAINGGDGTVSAVLTELFREGSERPLPALAVLSGGRTNMIAADVGLAGRNARALARLIAHAGQADSVPRFATREVIRMQWGTRNTARCGMFFGAAAICKAILLCRRRFESSRLPHWTASAATLAYLLGRRVLGGDRRDPVFSGEPVEVVLDGGRVPPQQLLLALVTTLDRLVLGARPFWGTGQGRLRYTAIAFPPVGLLRSAIPVLYGNRDRKLAEDVYLSCNADEVRLEMACPFTLDGELFDAAPGETVSLSAAGRVRFLQC